MSGNSVGSCTITLVIRCEKSIPVLTTDARKEFPRMISDIIIVLDITFLLILLVLTNMKYHFIVLLCGVFALMWC